MNTHGISKQIFVGLYEGVEGAQDDGLGFHCGQRPIFTMVEGLWPSTTQKARLSFNAHNDRRSLCNHRRSLLNTAEGLRDCKPLAEPRQSPGGSARAKPLEAPRILHFT